MKVLTVYIVREVLKGTFIAALILVTLFSLFTFTDELKNLGRGTYGLAQILQFLALSSPTLLHDVIPFAALIGSLAVVGNMANNREIVAMRTAGLSTTWIIRNIMLAGVVCMLFSITIGEFVAPSCDRAAQLLKITAQKDNIVKRSRFGMWLKEGKSFINVRKILEDGSLADIRIYELNDQHQLKKFTQAEHGKFLANQQWQLENVSYTEFALNQISAATLPVLLWQSNIDSDLLKVAVVSADNQSLYDLSNYIDFLKQNNQKSQRYEVAFWFRMFNPLVTFIMLLVSAPFVIGIGRGTSSGARIILGILIGEVFDALNHMMEHAAVLYELNPLLSAVLPSTVVFCAAVFAIRKSR